MHRLARSRAHGADRACWRRVSRRAGARTGADTSVHTPSEESRAVAELFPSARYVEFVGGDHIPAIVEPCVASVMVRFIEAFDPGDTSCAPDPGGPWYTPGDFPLRAANAVAARIDPSGRNQARLADRRIVAAGVAVLADAFYHGGKYFVSDGPGLRGGSYEAVFGEQSFIVRFDKYHFVRNVAVNGRMTISFEDGTSPRPCASAARRCVDATPCCG